MCLALYKPAKARLHKDDMRRAFTANPDGAGFAYFDPAQRRVEIMRGYFTFQAFWDDLDKLQDEKLAMIVHFRWATHGAVDRDNCHPFRIHDGALIHNGIIDWAEDGDAGAGTYSQLLMGRAMSNDADDRSDTRVFCEDYIAGMGARELRLAKRLIEKNIGWSKLVTMHDDGSVLIFNEEDGAWDRGVWYSNDSHKPSKKFAAVPKGFKGDKPYKEAKTAKVSRLDLSPQHYVDDDGYPLEDFMDSPQGRAERALAMRDPLDDDDEPNFLDYLTPDHPAFAGGLGEH